MKRKIFKFVPVFIMLIVTSLVFFSFYVKQVVKKQPDKQWSAEERRFSDRRIKDNKKYSKKNFERRLENRRVLA